MENKRRTRLSRPLNRRGFLATGLCLALSACATARGSPVSRDPSSDLPGTASQATEEGAAPVARPLASASVFLPQVNDQESQNQNAAQEILARMTLREKVGQLFLVFFQGPALSDSLRHVIESYHVGGLVLFRSAGNVESLFQVASLIKDAQSLASGSGAGVPLFVAVDQEGGNVVRIREGATVFPSNMTLGATYSPQLAYDMGSVTAAELRALGVNLNLAPVLDVNNNPANPVIGTRSFGSSPSLVSELGIEVIRAHKTEGVIATAKHFPGHGDTSTDSHLGLPLIPHDRERLDSVELAPFRQAIAAGVDAIMTAHVEVPVLEPEAGVPATLSARVLTGLLREELGFRGVIVTDSLGMGALSQRYTIPEVALAAFRAGADVLAYGADPGHAPEEFMQGFDAILAMVESGEIAQERLDESVLRIVALKEKYGLFSWQAPAPDSVAPLLGTEAHRQVAQEIANRAVTLVRNDGSLLPVGLADPLPVVVPESLKALAQAMKAHSITIEELRVSLDPTEAEIAAVVELAGGGQRVIVVATYDALLNPGQVALVKALNGRPLVVVALGSPYDLLHFPDVPCYLATYGDAEVSLNALARIMLGLDKPKGRLPVDLPGLCPSGHGLEDF